jgi:hypothetical protein
MGITAKKCEILYSITTKMTSERLQKTEHKTFKQFFYIANCFEVIRCQKRVFDLVPSPYCEILVQFSHLKQQ